MRDGRTVAVSRMADISQARAGRGHARARPATVRREGQTSFHGDGHAADRTLVAAEHLRIGAKVKDASLSVRAGEIVGLAGLLGSGRTEMARAIFGADRPDAGTISVEGKPVSFREPIDAIAAGSASAPRTARSRASSPKCRCART